MRRFCAVILVICLLCSGCALAQSSAKKQHQITYLDLFDTVTTIIATGTTETQFRQDAQNIYDQLLVYHQLFDIYHDYAGIHNLKTVNDQAGISPVAVEPAIIDLLLDCSAYYDLTGGKVNATMGSILRLWRQERELGIKLPDANALSTAAEHMGFDSIVIDEEASTVFITDPKVSLDVGAIAKGWAVQKVAEAAPAGMLISVGGNVFATGPKYTDGTPWVIGVQDPAGSGEYLCTLRVTGGAVVTSGDYQRFYTVDGKIYHHIIDPETRMPGTYWRSVTVVCPDSGLADALSTALFLLPLEEGQALAAQCGAQALWLDASGNEFMTPGFRELIQE